MTELSFLEVYEPLRVEGVSLVSGLEVEMRTGRTSGRAAISYDVTGIDPVVFLDESLRQVGIECLYSVLMSYHDDISVSTPIF